MNFLNSSLTARLSQNKHSLLSALALFALACTLHFSASEHASVVRLQKLGRLVERVLVFFVGLLLLLYNFGQIFSAPLFLKSLGPLLANLRQVLLLVLEVGLRLIALFVPLPHFLVVGLQGLCVLLVRTVESRQQLLLLRLVSDLDGIVLSREVLNHALKLVHLLCMDALTFLLDCLAIGSEVVFVLVLLGREVSAGLFEVVNFNARLLLGLLAFLHVLVKVVLFNFQLRFQLLHPLFR